MTKKLFKTFMLGFLLCMTQTTFAYKGDKMFKDENAGLDHYKAQLRYGDGKVAKWDPQWTIGRPYYLDELQRNMTEMSGQLGDPRQFGQGDVLAAISQFEEMSLRDINLENGYTVLNSQKIDYDPDNVGPNGRNYIVYRYGNGYMVIAKLNCYNLQKGVYIPPVVEEVEQTLPKLPIGGTGDVEATATGGNVGDIDVDVTVETPVDTVGNTYITNNYEAAREDEYYPYEQPYSNGGYAGVGFSAGISAGYSYGYDYGYSSCTPYYYGPRHGGGYVSQGCSGGGNNSQPIEITIINEVYASASSSSSSSSTATNTNTNTNTGGGTNPPPPDDDGNPVDPPNGGSPVDPENKQGRIGPFRHEDDRSSRTATATNNADVSKKVRGDKDNSLPISTTRDHASSVKTTASNDGVPGSTRGDLDHSRDPLPLRDQNAIAMNDSRQDVYTPAPSKNSTRNYDAGTPGSARPDRRDANDELPLPRKIDAPDVRSNQHDSNAPIRNEIRLETNHNGSPGVNSSNPSRLNDRVNPDGTPKYSNNSNDMRNTKDVQSAYNPPKNNSRVDVKVNDRSVDHQPGKKQEVVNPIRPVADQPKKSEVRNNNVRNSHQDYSQAQKIKTKKDDGRDHVQRPDNQGVKQNPPKKNQSRVNEQRQQQQKQMRKQAPPVKQHAQKQAAPQQKRAPAQGQAMRGNSGGKSR